MNQTFAESRIDCEEKSLPSWASNEAGGQPESQIRFQFSLKTRNSRDALIEKIAGKFIALKSAGHFNDQERLHA